MIGLVFLALLAAAAFVARASLGLVGLVAPGTGSVGSVLLSAAIFPGLLWLLALGVDLYGAAYHRGHPQEPFMGGISIIAIPPLLACFAIGCVVAAIARTRS